MLIPFCSLPSHSSSCFFHLIIFVPLLHAVSSFFSSPSLSCHLFPVSSSSTPSSPSLSLSLFSFLIHAFVFFSCDVFLYYFLFSIFLIFLSFSLPLFLCIVSTFSYFSSPLLSLFYLSLSSLLHSLFPHFFSLLISFMLSHVFLFFPLLSSSLPYQLFSPLTFPFFFFFSSWFHLYFRLLQPTPCIVHLPFSVCLMSLVFSYGLSFSSLLISISQYLSSSSFSSSIIGSLRASSYFLSPVSSSIPLLFSPSPPTQCSF